MNKKLRNSDSNLNLETNKSDEKKNKVNIEDTNKLT